MKRFTEKFKQKWGLGSTNKEWRPTSNGRNDAMLRDVRLFAKQLKATLKEVKDMSTQIDTSMSTFRSVLLSPLPRAHDEMPAGVMPIDREVHLIGLNVTPEGLTAASQEVQQRLTQDVALPLEQWLSAYRETKDLYKKCEAVRLDLDNKRRTVLVLQEKYQSKNRDQTRDRNREAEAALHKVVNEEDKLTRLAQRYAEMEAQVFNAFLQLIRDSAMLRDFIASSLAFLQRCFTSAYTAFEVAPPPPMPVLPAPVPVPLLTYTPADINVSMRLSANSMMGMQPGPVGRAVSPRVQMPYNVTARSQSGLGASYGTAPALLTSATFANGTQPALGPYPQAPPSPNADTMRRASQNHTFYPNPNDNADSMRRGSQNSLYPRSPTTPNAEEPAIPDTPAMPTPQPFQQHVAPAKQPSATVLVPPVVTVWRPTPPSRPEQSPPRAARPPSENGSETNPFEQQLPAAPTHQVPSHTTSTTGTTHQPVRDPQNPFVSEDGTGRRAIPA